MKILVTGAAGMVGSHVVDVLRAQGHDVHGTFHDECDLRDPYETRRLLLDIKPEQVFHAAARVYGIVGNMNNQGKSFLENVQINTSVLDAAKFARVKKVTVMGTGCVYPYPPLHLPLVESDIFMGRPHPSEAGYAHAKLAMLAMLEAYSDSFEWAYVVSCNLFGTRDKFDKLNGHVVPALVCKFYEAKRDNTDVTVWGDGSAQRDFIYIKDAARFIESVMHDITGPINMGASPTYKIRDVVETLARVAGVSEERILWDTSKPNGVDYRSYDLTRMRGMGFVPHYSLEDGLRETWEWYCSHA